MSATNYIKNILSLKLVHVCTVHVVFPNMSVCAAVHINNTQSTVVCRIITHMYIASMWNEIAIPCWNVQLKNNNCNNTSTRPSEC